jgi:hypothetical protein
MRVRANLDHEIEFEIEPISANIVTKVQKGMRWLILGKTMGEHTITWMIVLSVHEGRGSDPCNATKSSN